MPASTIVDYVQTRPVGFTRNRTDEEYELEKLLLTVEEVGQMTGLGRTLLYEKLKSGELRSVTVGRCRRVSRAAVEEFVSNLEEAQAGR